MSRDYGRVYSTFWTSKTTGQLSDDGKLLALYLLSCPHNTITGVFRLPDGYVCEDLGWPSERVAKGFAQLASNGFAGRCDATKWVWIQKHLEWNRPENPNQRKAAAKIAQSVPDECRWKDAFLAANFEHLGLPKPKNNPSGTVHGNPFETVPKGLPVTVPEPFSTSVDNQEQEQEQKETLLSKPEPGPGPGSESEFPEFAPEPGKRPPRESALTAAQLAQFERFYAAYPRREARGDAEKAWKAIDPDDALVARMVTAVGEQRLVQRRRNPDEARYVPLPATWLRDKRWRDEPEASRADFTNEVAL